ncbi:MAG: fumarate hydratase [Proteobacteria bacterium]|nr:fumarate hydratase [Pseudomonadota bacterium]
MRKVSTSDITAKVSELCIEAACNLGTDVIDAIKSAEEREESVLGKDVLGQLVYNFELANKEHRPMCQDTGITIVYAEVGREVEFDGSLDEAIHEGVRQGYDKGYLRKSVCDPLSRVNTTDNTPAIIHTTIVEGDKLNLTIATKGAGSENMSGLAMLKPSQGVEGVKDFIIQVVKDAGGNPCPPVVVGVGIGGSFEKCAMLSKKAIMRTVGEANADPEIAALETELLLSINNLGIGPMGFGGMITALAVHIEKHPCHIASLPVAVNMQCHADRHKHAVL